MVTDLAVKLNPRQARYAIVVMFLAQFISVSGDRLFSIAVSWWVVDQSELQDRELILGLLLAASTLPAALAGPFLGSLIDKYSKRACMVAADFFRLTLMAGLAYLLHHQSLDLPLLFAFCILIFSFEPLFDTAVSASLSPLSRDTESLSQLVALESAIPNLGAVMGALVGSMLLAAWATETAFWFNAASFLISLLLVMTLPAVRSPGQTSRDAARAYGYGFLKTHRSAARLMACFGLANFFVAPLFFYLPLLVRDVLKADASGLAQLELAFAGGNLVILAWLFARPKIYRRVRWLRFLLVGISGPFLYFLAQAEDTSMMLAVLSIWGGSIAFVTYLAITSFQVSIPDEYKGRFFALFNSLCTLSLPLSFACVGALSTKFSLQELMYGNAACITVIALAFLSVPDEAQGKIHSL